MYYEQLDGLVDVVVGIFGVERILYVVVFQIQEFQVGNFAPNFCDLVQLALSYITGLRIKLAAQPLKHISRGTPWCRFSLAPASTRTFNASFSSFVPSSLADRFAASVLNKPKKVSADNGRCFSDDAGSVHDKIDRTHPDGKNYLVRRVRRLAPSMAVLVATAQELLGQAAAFHGNSTDPRRVGAEVYSVLCLQPLGKLSIYNPTGELSIKVGECGSGRSVAWS